MKTTNRLERGQAIVLLVLALIGMLAFAGLAVDGGMLYSDRRIAQNAADTAAMNGAFALASNNLAGVVDQAMKRAKSNGFGGTPSEMDIHHAIYDDGKTRTEVYWPPSDGPYQGDMQYIQVKIRHTVNTSFIHLVYPGLTRSEVQAVAKVVPSGPTGQGNSLVGLSPNKCKTVSFHGNGTTTIKDGGVFSNSTKCNKQTVLGCSDSCDSGSMDGVAGSVTVENGSIQSVGSFNFPPGHLSPNPVNGSEPIDYPLVPIPDCATYTSRSATPDNTGGNITPGRYDSIFINNNPTAVLTMQPGVYCIEKDFTINGGTIKVGGSNPDDGIFIYMMNIDNKSSFYISGDAKVDIRASKNTSHPNTFQALEAGTLEPIGLYNYNGLLLYFNPNSPASPSSVSISGNPIVSGDSTVTGSIIAPSVHCSVLGTAQTVTLSAEIICDTVEVGGDGTLEMDYKADDLFQFSGRADLSK